MAADFRLRLARFLLFSVGLAYAQAFYIPGTIVEFITAAKEHN